MELWELQASFASLRLSFATLCTPIGCDKVRDVIKELRMWLPRVLVWRVTTPTHQVLDSTLVVAVRTQFLYMKALRAMTVN